MSLTRPSLFARIRRRKAAVSGESGFVLVFVMLAGLILIMTAVSLVSRTTSGATTAAQESRTQGARMAAEYGFNVIMARINKEYDTANSINFIDTENLIPGLPTTSYTIRSFNPPPTRNIKTCDTTNTNVNDVNLSIMGNLTIGSSIYTQVITRTIRVCKPNVDSTQLRVRSFS